MAGSNQETAKAMRAREVENALASVRMEGLEPSEEMKALFHRYIEGALTSEELDSAIDTYLARQYGPVRLSGQ